MAGGVNSLEGKKRLSLGLIFGVGAVCLVLMIPLSIGVWRYRLKGQVNGRLASVRAEGLPTSGAELNSWIPPVVDARNGALVIGPALWKKIQFGGSNTSDTEVSQLLETNHWSLAKRAEVAAWAATNATVFAEVRRGLGFPSFRYPVDYTPGVATLVPHLAQLIGGARMLALKAALDGESGELPAWRTDVEMILKLARTLDGDPLVISFLVRSSMTRIASKAVGRQLNLAAPSDDDCKLLQMAFASTMETNVLPSALIGERAIGIGVFQMDMAKLEQMGGEEWDKSVKPAQLNWFLSATGFRDRDERFYLDSIEKAIAIAKLPPPQSLVLTNQMAEIADEARKKLYIFTSMIVAGLGKATVKDATDRAEASFVIAALGIEMYRRAHQQQLPESLSELIPEYLRMVPIDPFDGKEIRYKQNGKGYLLYSVDADGIDNGGEVRPPKWKPGSGTTFDLVFKVERKGQ